jgi:hypothetical protein
MSPNAERMSRGDPAWPLWQFHIIEPYEGSSAVVARMHHCIADGIALINVMVSITDGGIDPPQHRNRGMPAAVAENDGLADAVLKPLTDLTVRAIGLYGEGLTTAVEALDNPATVTGSLDAVRTGARELGDATALALMPDDTPTLLKGKPVGRKVLAWSEPLPLDAVKAVLAATGLFVKPVQYAVQGLFSKKATAVMTHAPGPANRHGRLRARVRAAADPDVDAALARPVRGLSAAPTPRRVPHRRPDVLLA